MSLTRAIALIEAAKKATPADPEWLYFYALGPNGFRISNGAGVFVAKVGEQKNNRTRADARFIALSRNDAPAIAEALVEACELLKEDAAQFRFYEKQHRAKQTPEADEKAEVNAKLAAARELFLAKMENGNG